MHAGKLTGDAAAARVYRILRSRCGHWFGGWELTLAAQTSAISTRIAEIREQVPERGERIERTQAGRRFYYRLVEARPLTLSLLPAGGTLRRRVSAD